MLICSWDFPHKNTGMDCHFLLLGIFSTQRWNPRLLRLLRCGQLNHRGSPILCCYCYLNSNTPPFHSHFHTISHHPMELPIFCCAYRTLFGHSLLKTQLRKIGMNRTFLERLLGIYPHFYLLIFLKKKSLKTSGASDEDKTYT